MRRLSITLCILSALVFSSCTDTDNALSVPTGPETPENAVGYVEECHANMVSIFSASVIFFAENGFFPSSLEELGQPYSEMNCPGCGLPYECCGDQENMKVFCGFPFEPDHGGILNGIAMWSPEPGEFETACRANMRTIASQEVIYFAYNQEYTESLEELGLGNVTCPECYESYILQVNDEGNEYYLECGKPFDPNHGSINNGVPSWQEPTAE